MQKIAKLGLSAVAAFALMFTTTISVVAQEKVNGSDNVEVKESVGAHVPAKTLEKLKSRKEAKANSIYKWYPISIASSTAPNNITLADIEPMDQAPDVTNDEACAQEENDGDLCAVLIEFLGTATDFELDGTTLADALDNNPDAVGIATDVPSEDADEDGFAKSPEPESINNQ